jgi:hypothetical protein
MEWSRALLAAPVPVRVRDMRQVSASGSGATDSGIFIPNGKIDRVVVDDPAICYDKNLCG